MRGALRLLAAIGTVTAVITWRVAADSPNRAASTLSLLEQPPGITDEWIATRHPKRGPDFPIDLSRFHLGFVEGDGDDKEWALLEALLRLDLLKLGACDVLTDKVPQSLGGNILPPAYPGSGAAKSARGL